MMLSQPIQVYYMPGSLGANRVQVRFGGRVKVAVNAQHPQQQVYTIMVQTTEDLREISDTVKAWIYAPSPQGPIALPLSDFLRQNGLA